MQGYFFFLLAERLGLNISFDANSTANGTTEGIISLSIDDVYDLNGTLIMEDEAYSIITDSFENSFAIVGTDLAGIFHGAQSFWSLYNEFQSSVPCVTVSDYPRFSYRGLMVDVARNFLPKEEIVKLLEAMSMYKMNKFHFHLTDDEGWRLEIPGIEELTEVKFSSFQSFVSTQLQYNYQQFPISCHCNNSPRFL